MRRTRVLVAEDSATVRVLLLDILGSDPELEVAGEAKDGVEAVKMTVRLRPDIVVMDIHMPNLDGFEATRRIMAEAPTPIVIVTATSDARDVALSFNAVTTGALALLGKPSDPGHPEFSERSRQFLATLKAMARVKVVRRWPRKAGQAPPAPARLKGTQAQIVAIAASTGGPAALQRILLELPGGFPAPILVVQHIAEGFIGGLAEWLNGQAEVRVRVAEHGESLSPGSVYLAPDGRHLGLNGRRSIDLSAEPPVGGFRPSGSFLFESVARDFGASAVAVILTGMGADGVAGLRAIRERGGRVIAQDEASSVVFGMPGEAVAAGLADAVLPLGDIAAQLTELVMVKE